MNKIYFSALVCASLLLCTSQVIAQRKKGNPSTFRGEKVRYSPSDAYTTVSFSINAMNYFGDLAPRSGALSTELGYTRPGFGIAASRKLGNNIFIRGSFIYGRLFADDNAADPTDAEGRFRYARNQHFRNDIKELAVVSVYDFISRRGVFLNRPAFTPYAFAGVAIFHHNPKAIVPDTYWNDGTPLPEAGQWIELQPLGTEGQYANGSGVNPYKRIQIAIPFGLGVKYKISNRLDLSVEIGYRYLFFDYIDDVSGEYANLGLLDDNLSRAMSFRAKEPTAVVSGKQRNFEAIGNTTTPYSYDGYDVYAGYGAEGDQRGGSGNDTYIITSVQISYLIANNLRKPKYRR